jgi:putative amide transporter protein
MGALGLLFVGAVLFVNGMALLGRVDPRAAAPINLFVGALLVVVVLSLALPAGEDLTPVFTAAGFLLFGFVYLYVGIVNLTGHAATGVGWYCGWAAVVSLCIALVTYVRDDDAKLGTLWLLWALLFTFFFLVLGLGLVRLTTVTGWITVVEAIVTATAPGLLLLLGAWTDVPDLAVVAVAVASVVLFVVIGVGTARGRPTGAAEAVQEYRQEDSSSRT